VSDIRIEREVEQFNHRHLQVNAELVNGFRWQLRGGACILYYGPSVIELFYHRSKWISADWDDEWSSGGAYFFQVA